MLDVVDGLAESPKASYEEGNDVEAFEVDRGRLMFEPAEAGSGWLVMCRPVVRAARSPP